MRWGFCFLFFVEGWKDGCFGRGCGRDNGFSLDDAHDKIVALCEGVLVFLDPTKDAVDGLFCVIHPCGRDGVCVGQVGHILCEKVVEFLCFFDVTSGAEEALEFQTGLAGCVDALCCHFEYSFSFVVEHLPCV